MFTSVVRILFTPTFLAPSKRGIPYASLITKPVAVLLLLITEASKLTLKRDDGGGCHLMTHDLSGSFLWTEGFSFQ